MICQRWTVELYVKWTSQLFTSVYLALMFSHEYGPSYSFSQSVTSVYRALMYFHEYGERYVAVFR